MLRNPLSGIAVACVLAAAVSSCSGSTGAPAGSPGGTAAVLATDPQAATRAPFVIEDAGLEVELAPGAYVSRLFVPSLRFELGTGWFRRDQGDARKLSLRTGPNGDRDVTFVSGVDFLQCGSGPVLTKPGAAAIVDAIADAPRLTIAQRRDAPVAGRTGTELRFVADPMAVLPEDLDRWLELGCMMTLGDAPFPADGSWLGVTADANQQLIVVDIAGTTLLVRGRPSSASDDHYDAILDIVARMALG